MRSIHTESWFVSESHVTLFSCTLALLCSTRHCWSCCIAAHMKVGCPACSFSSLSLQESQHCFAPPLELVTSPRVFLCLFLSLCYSFSTYPLEQDSSLILSNCTRLGSRPTAPAAHSSSHNGIPVPTSHTTLGLRLQRLYRLSLPGRQCVHKCFVLPTGLVSG